MSATYEARPGLPRAQLVSLPAAAEHLGCKARTLYDWVKSAHPPIAYYMIGGVYKFDLADLDDYLVAVRIEGCRKQGVA